MTSASLKRAPPAHEGLRAHASSSRGDSGPRLFLDLPERISCNARPAPSFTGRTLGSRCDASVPFGDSAARDPDGSLRVSPSSAALLGSCARTSDEGEAARDLGGVAFLLNSEYERPPRLSRLTAGDSGPRSFFRGRRRSGYSTLIAGRPAPSSNARFSRARSDSRKSFQAASARLTLSR